ncbi:MAG: N-acetylmuramoyl-L-alanine amidase [Gallionellales bacterium RIFOXYB12_FULL_54_9]|nr:MAG: N-acetylmuramoyl-L-alanine amidase [Gallionellales bacterium RIFOXYB12_FULL_54_9]
MKFIAVARRKQWALCCLLLWLPQANAAIEIVAARIWPAQDYTRLTLESKQPIHHHMFSVENPDRLVIDLEGVEHGAALNQLSEKIGEDDPYIKSVRVGRFKPGVVRLVFDLKNQVKPQLFDLNPVGEYGHRMVLDIYPAKATDAMMALLDQDITTGEALPLINKPAEPTGKAAHTGKNQPAITQRQPELRARTLIIAIDAGHGGEDPGARGSRGSHEKDVTLAIARRLNTLINETPNMRGVLIRDGDYFIPLGGRVAKARKARADLFVSIHADAFIKPDAHGSSVFALSEHGATSTAARWLAKKENEADLIGGVNIAVKDPYLARTLLDLSQTATINDSIRLARHVLGELDNINDLHSGHVEQAGFAVLKSPDIPSILVETAFISNPAEEARLNDENYQTKLANAVLIGIKRYFAQNPALSKQNIAQNY